MSTFLIVFNRSDNKITKLGPLSLNLLVSKVLLSKVKLCSTDLNDNPLSLRALTWINGSDLRIGPSSLLAGLARVGDGRLERVNTIPGNQLWAAGN